MTTSVGDRPSPSAPPRSADLVILSNRLPVTVTVADGGGGYGLERSAGGLASAVAGAGPDCVWVGWPGRVVPAGDEAALEEELAAGGLFPVWLDAAEEDAFYRRTCNDTLWPLFHYFVGRSQFDADAWQRYVEVNERFAERAAERAPARGRVWVHDYHLLLVPAALRRLRPDLSIGLFLHVPFPASEIFRLLPSREAVLRGMLGADYVGFQTGDYVSHFRASCLRVLGIESTPESIEHQGRIVGVGADPVGTDVARFRRSLEDPETRRVHAELEERFRGRQLILGVERLDYSKGIPQKLRAFERVLELEPERAATTTMLQVLVPSRLESVEYRAQRDEIELLVSGINGRFATPGNTPVEYLHHGIDLPELAALYRRADVMAVTPLRDGMNLVAQEFVVCQSARGLPGRARGILVLSELAGAAQVLPAALLVNPWDTDDLAMRLVEALEAPASERQRRLALMSPAVDRLDCRRWASRSLRRLAGSAARSRRLAAAAPLGARARRRVERLAAAARARTILLDYDGTLREIVQDPSLARPTREILDLLTALASLPATDVHVVSGRTTRDLDEWLGHLPISLCAEHGYRTRRPGRPWEATLDVDLAWKPRVTRLLRRTAEQVPGSFVELKACSVAWHYRRAEQQYAEWRARELLLKIDELLHGVPAEVLRGHRVLEVRPKGVNKGTYVAALFPDGRSSGHFVLCAGDDQTDADTYDALPAGAVAVHVGRTPPHPRGASTRDRYVVDTPAALRDLLHGIAAASRAPRAPRTRQRVA